MFSGAAAAAAAAALPPGFAEVVVVRHGETSWNASKTIQGQLDAELNEKGRQQANAVRYEPVMCGARKFSFPSFLIIRVFSVKFWKAGVKLSKEPKFAAIYASDLQRAAETANIIASYCYLPKVVLDPALRERHLGDLQGLTLHSAAKQKPAAHNIFFSSRRDQEIPGGGESLDQLSERCVSSLQKIAGQHKGERVIVVTHGGVLRELYRRANPGAPRGGTIHNTSVNVFHISDPGDPWIIKKWGDISHLKETGVLKSGFGGDRTSG